jgi:outer membrane protein OmpA-like peptidoglycan-associated protein
MKVQLSTQTDAIGNTLYNQDLSQRRAINAKQYLINKGVEASRIIALGFGESRIRNQCTEGVPCSEEDHQFNRQTEVLVSEE